MWTPYLLGPSKKIEGKEKDVRKLRQYIFWGVLPVHGGLSLGPRVKGSLVSLAYCLGHDTEACHVTLRQSPSSSVILRFS